MTRNRKLAVTGLSVLVAGLSTVSALSVAAPAAQDGWVKLFNGKDLSGWDRFLDPKAGADPDKIWTVKDGVIICEGSVPGYLTTQKEYDNYVLRLEWRWGTRMSRGRNSGVFVHVVGPDKIWPKGVEAQLMSEHAGDFWLVDGAKLWINPRQHEAKGSRHYYRLKDGVEKPVGEWNQYEITCKGGAIKLVINGHLVNIGTESELTRGKILLQSEGAEIHFRNVELKPIAE